MTNRTSSIPPPDELVVVVCLGWDDGAPLAKPLASQMAVLAQQAEALGATLCGFGGLELAFAFPDPDRDEAIHFVARSVRKAIELGPIAAGVSRGMVRPFGQPDTFVSLVTGDAVRVASALARHADRGAVLVDAEVDANNELVLLDPLVTIDVAGRARNARSLDLAQPFTNQNASVYEDTHEGPIVPKLPRRPPERRTGSFRMVDLAKEALARGSADGLDYAIRQLKLTGQHEDLVERLVGVLAFTRGAKEEGLRILRRAAENEQHGDRRARAVLAYAVAVAAAGRPEDAVLEALSALALTRTHADRSGEIACARFLAQLSFATGHADAASAWEHVAQRVAAG